MPMTMWEDIIGEDCVECKKPASHYWLSTPVCCQCHGGGLFSAEETQFVHDFWAQHGRGPKEDEVPKEFML